jgi:glycosyltransferase involved in cell wall biosynthesis
VIICHIISGLSVGGAELMLFKLLRQSDRTRFKHVVISLTDKGHIGQLIQDLDITVYTLDMDPGKLSLSKFYRLILMIRKLKPDLVHSWMSHSNMLAYLCRSFSKRKFPIIWGILQSIYDLRYEKMSTALCIRVCSFLSKHVQRIVYASKISARQHEALGYDSKVTEVISIGIDCEEFKPSKNAGDKVRSSLHIKDNNILIGLIGRYHPMKDHANFFRAISILTQKYNDISFVLAGTGVEKNNPDIVKLLNECPANVYLLGKQEDVPAILDSLDIFVSSSYTEAFPTVVCEAMACGVPCVVTDVGDSSWIVGDTGRIVPPKDSLALANMLADMIEMGSDERRKLGIEARLRIMENFSLPEVVAKYENLYERFIGDEIR